MWPGLIGSATGPAPKVDRLSGSGPDAVVARLRVCHGPAVLGGRGALAAVRARWRRGHLRPVEQPVRPARGRHLRGADCGRRPTRRPARGVAGRGARARNRPRAGPAACGGRLAVRCCPAPRSRSRRSSTASCPR